ncbi:Plexin-C1 [Nibea albiflora]|uniref:Plexin-C1 n=1 Tax=Nibea albiflora TaxID=240163 RepID=A0ACB7EV48_NIBAL|nr:Plexin-C1 [Nibea albiflora]
MILLPALLLFLWGEPGRCLAEKGFTFDGRIRQFAVANNALYIATQEKLYQLSHDLILVQSVTQRGILKGGPSPNDAQFHRVSETDERNATFSVNILLPFVVNRTVISCGFTDNECGYCELLDPKNISNVLHREDILVGPPWNRSESVGFLVNVEKTAGQNETYILTAIQQGKPTSTSCSSGSDAVNLHNTNDKQTGLIFSSSGDSTTATLKSKRSVEFVDGFQINSIIYLFSNLPSKDKRDQVRLIWLEGKTSKSYTFKSLRGATLSISDGGEGSRLVASSVIPGGPPVLWSGVFSVDGAQANTELVLFDISPDLTGDTDKDPDFCFTCTDTSKPTPKTLKPKKVLLRQSNMTSVLAVRQKAWMVFFIGTGDGQLIKLVVDKNYHTACPRVLYRANDDRQVFPKMHLDQVDRKHVYVPLLPNQMERVPVSKCSTYTNVQDCLSAQDPYCVWCSSKTSCTFEDDCPDSDWVSIPDDSQHKMLSYKVVKDSAKQITLHIQTHLTLGQQAPSAFSCQFSPSSSSSEFCSRTSPAPQFPKCTCILTNSTLPVEGLDVTVKKPEITSISPSVVSFYGSNNAVLSGLNLGNVTRVRFQLDMNCMLQESPVLSNTGERLKFHIPSSNKGVVKVCAVLPDDSCHGNALITYQSSPSCTSIAPSSTWISGKRKLTVTGSHLQFVEEIVHEHKQTNVRPPIQKVKPRRDSNLQTLTYETPAAPQGIYTSTMSLKVANETLPCSTINYYPEPEFIRFTPTQTGNDVRITIQKKADKLEMTTAELSVWGVQDEKEYPCIMEDKENSNETDFFICEIQKTPSSFKLQMLEVKYGDKTVRLEPPSLLYQVLVIVRFLLIPCIIAACSPPPAEDSGKQLEPDPSPTYPCHQPAGQLHLQTVASSCTLTLHLQTLASSSSLNLHLPASPTNLQAASTCNLWQAAVPGPSTCQPAGQLHL